MYSVTVRDNMMIAHSLRGDVFGPAQRLHGATYVVEVTLFRADLDADGIVADIGRAAALLGDILAPYAYRNLDELAEFAGRNTTTEILARAIFEHYAEGVRAGRLDGDAGRAIESLAVTLRENPDAWACYEGAVRG
jgi:6-pyruvoyl-tetrahydropterin synthase